MLNRRLAGPLIAYLILALGFTLSIARIYTDEQRLCGESHRRYDTLHAVVITSTTVSPIARERVTAAQLAQLEAYYRSLRARLLGDLGDPPTC